MKKRAISTTSRRRGFALVIVLCIVVLLVALAVGFIVRATSERSAASGYHASVLARQLADTVTSLVQGQINAASTQGSDVDWVSQPGMVRTFDTSGNLIKAYKLYSASNMIATSLNIASDVPASNWATDTALFVDLNAPIEVGGVKNFPILDPTLAISDTTSAPLGYAVNSAPGASAYQPAPMPTRWLYVLRDGTIVSPTGSGKVATIAGESAGNPVIGRVAFWTDDDSCKVNVNTASEGTFWDVPRAETNQEYDLGNFQPANKEFQRYPGHPAMTSLSAIFPQMTRDQIYSLVPRVGGGGSQGGTVVATGAVALDSDRIYDSVDELIFDPSRVNTSGLTREKLELAKFFLTAHSRAPETNLHNLPRIACWPIFKGLATGRVTAFDRLIAFCASTGTTGNLKPYYFQREKAASPTWDITDPSLSRNVDLYAYLQYLTGQPIPGFGGNFLTKYGNDRDQILTEIFDYIRCTNLHDDFLQPNNQFTSYWSSTSMNNLPAGYGWVAPIHFTAPNSSEVTMGFGRTFSLSELGIGFICNASGLAADAASNSNVLTNPVLSASGTLPNNQKYIQAILLPEFFSPMLGNVALCPDIVLEIKGLEYLRVDSVAGVGTLLFPAASGEVSYNAVYPNIDGSRIWGGNPSWRYLFWNKGAPGRAPFAEDTDTSIYPFIGAPVKMSTDAGFINFTGGALTVNLYAKTSDPVNLIQSYTVFVPSGTFPFPKPMDTFAQKPADLTIAPKESWWSFNKSSNGRLVYVTSKVAAPGPGSFMLNNYDVVRTVLPPHGDFRLAAATFSGSTNLFQKHPLYDAGVSFASSLCGPYTANEQGFTGGKYITGLTYNTKWIPDIPSNATETPQATGDYDNANGRAMDGPLINKPDEGATKRIAGRVPYFDDSGADYVGGQSFFSPNRQMPSPGMFGSLPTGVKANVPWRTLLFRPQSGHFGATSPKDHLFLDLFWMPVVEPYAISDRFSTAGKINMNYQILPFTYIERSTGIQALLKSEKVSVIPNGKAAGYKIQTNSPDKYILDINTSETLSQFVAKFASGDVFKSASEICDLHIVPSGATLSGMGTYWNSNALTGDNSRERIYTTLYPRLTTRSNTYTVHCRVQSLKKNPGSTAGTWTEGKDSVTGEYRGSTTLERFIDANNSKIPDYAASPSLIPTMKTLDTFYKWRVVENKQFAP